MSVRGSCLCGGVRFSVNGPLRDAVACHCAQCRKTSGHFVAATSARREDVTMLSDATLAWYRSSRAARRGFCNVCGASIFWDRIDGPRLSIHAGVLDAPTGLRLIGHIFCADKGDYYDIDDGLPQADAASPDLTTA